MPLNSHRLKSKGEQQYLLEEAEGTERTEGTYGIWTSSRLALIKKHLGLTWRNSESTTDSQPSCSQALIAPPAEQLEVLYENAMLGMMSQIRQQMDEIEQLDAKYVPFANSRTWLAKVFEDEKIVALVEQYLAGSQPKKPNRRT